MDMCLNILIIQEEKLELTYEKAPWSISIFEFGKRKRKEKREYRI